MNLGNYNKNDDRFTISTVGVVVKQSYVKQTFLCALLAQSSTVNKGMDVTAGISHLPTTSLAIDNRRQSGGVF